jgi:outer membrane murein-binding lipoprotein Lpp
MTDTTNTEMIRLSELNAQLERERNDLRYEANALCVNLLYLLRTGATKEQLESRIDAARTKIRAAAMPNDQS